MVRNRTPGEHENRRRHGALAILLLCAVPAAAETAEITELRRQIDEIRREYGQRLSDLERRLAALEAESGLGPGGAPPPDRELAELRRSAREAAALPTAPLEAPAQAPVGPAIGRQRNLNRLNPEISMTGIVLGIGSDQQREEFQAREFELDLQATLDPFSRTRWTLAFAGEEVEIEEGYVVYSSLPGGLELTGGKFRQTFGPLNRQHLHALPQTDYPLPLRAYFGEEGLAQTGVSLGWLLPRPWASSNEVTLQITDGSNEAFGGEDFEELAVLGHLKNFWDLSDATYFEWGLSGVLGETAGGGESRVWGTDFTLHWQPPQRAKYREITWRSELLLSERDDPDGLRQRAWGAYSYLEGLLQRNLYLGARAELAEDPMLPERRRWGIVPYLTWWQSEWVRIRGEFQFLKDDLTDEEENRFVLQLTWAAGPHKHETY